MDPVHFTGWEVHEMAIKIEENGMRYYTDASRAAKTRKLKDLFKMLADEEGKHGKVFLELKKLVPEDEKAAGFDPYITEASLYLRAIADTEVFTKPGEGKKLGYNAKDEKEALAVAIDMEKDSILFYYELQKMIREKDRKVLDALIDQEKEHLKKLSSMRQDIFA
ncbi:MAG: ferritin family protein [Deltaproteobacteria bacterium]|nr:ferritin family protein [Deltaproteobacteria bacterium]